MAGGVKEERLGGAVVPAAGAGRLSASPRLALHAGAEAARACERRDGVGSDGREEQEQEQEDWDGDILEAEVIPLEVVLQRRREAAMMRGDMVELLGGGSDDEEGQGGGEEAVEVGRGRAAGARGGRRYGGLAGPGTAAEREAAARLVADMRAEESQREEDKKREKRRVEREQLEAQLVGWRGPKGLAILRWFTTTKTHIECLHT